MHCSTRPPTKCNVTYYGYNYSMWYQMVHLISYHIFERKWNWPTIVLKYFVSEKIISTKNGGGGTHFARSLNSKFLKGLTHSALSISFAFIFKARHLHIFSLLLKCLFLPFLFAAKFPGSEFLSTLCPLDICLDPSAINSSPLSASLQLWLKRSCRKNKTKSFMVSPCSWGRHQ